MKNKSLDIYPVSGIYLSMLNNNPSHCLKRKAGFTLVEMSAGRPKPWRRQPKSGFTLIEMLACQPKPWRRQAKSGFTLIEMLVVIAILVLLVSILQPAIQNTLARARISGCMSNLGQQGSAFISYAIENNQRLPEYKKGRHWGHWGHCDAGWERALAPYMNEEIPDKPNVATGSRAFICPASNVTWDPNLGNGSYRHRGVPAGGNNPYDGLYYNYAMSTISTQLNNTEPNDRVLRINFYVNPSRQPVQWCSQRLSPDPTIDYNTNTLGPLSWHQRIAGRPTLFMDGSVITLRRAVHNTIGEQVMQSAKHGDNTNYNPQRNIARKYNGGTFGINP